jgi:hypothetical protein
VLAGNFIHIQTNMGAIPPRHRYRGAKWTRSGTGARTVYLAYDCRAPRRSGRGE